MKIIDIKDLHLRKIKNVHEGKLREFDDHYEYCLVDDYEIIYDEFQLDSIQMDDMFISILEYYGQFELVSIQFQKTYAVHEIVEWIDGHVIGFNTQDKEGYYVEGANKILQGVLYKNMSLIIASKGNQKLYINQLDEVTEGFESYSKIINPDQAKTVELTETNTSTSNQTTQWIDDMDSEFNMNADYLQMK